MRSYHFLQQSRHGVWYFRIRVPRVLRLFFGRSELRRSLMTCELKQARLEAHLLSVYAGRLFSTLRRALSDGRPLTPGLGIMAREFMPFGITIPTPDGPLKIEADPRIPGDVEAAQETIRQIFPQGMVMASSLGSGTAAALPPSRLMSKVAESFTQMAMADGERTKATVSEYASVIREFIAKTGDLQKPAPPSTLLSEIAGLLRDLLSKLDNWRGPLSTK